MIFKKKVKDLSCLEQNAKPDSRHLSFSGQGITEFLWKEYSEYCPNLILLDLSKNTINTIRDVFLFQNLISLNLDFNTIPEIPNEIGNLTNLKSLSLANNKIKYLPESIGELEKLEKLNLAGNYLTYLPLSLLNLLRLEKLVLTDNPLVFPPAALCTTKAQLTFQLIKSSLRMLSIPGAVKFSLGELREELLETGKKPNCDMKELFSNNGKLYNIHISVVFSAHLNQNSRKHMEDSLIIKMDLEKETLYNTMLPYNIDTWEDEAKKKASSLGDLLDKTKDVSSTDLKGGKMTANSGPFTNSREAKHKSETVRPIKRNNGNGEKHNKSMEKLEDGISPDIENYKKSLKSNKHSDDEENLTDSLRGKSFSDPPRKSASKEKTKESRSKSEKPSRKGKSSDNKRRKHYATQEDTSNRNSKVTVLSKTKPRKSQTGTPEPVRKFCDPVQQQQNEKKQPEFGEPVKQQSEKQKTEKQQQSVQQLEKKKKEKQQQQIEQKPEKQQQTEQQQQKNELPKIENPDLGEDQKSSSHKKQTSDNVPSLKNTDLILNNKNESNNTSNKGSPQSEGSTSPSLTARKDLREEQISGSLSARPLECTYGEDKNSMTFDSTTVLPKANTSNVAIFGVFDGHGGRGTVSFLEKNFIPSIINQKTKIIAGDFKGCISDAFLQFDSMLLEQLDKHRDVSGSTAIFGILQGNYLIVTWLGDSRGILCRGKKPVGLSWDHTPLRYDEKRRIEKLGGKVHLNDKKGDAPRVMQSLAVTRAFGDIRLKKSKYIISEPEFTEILLVPEDQFILFATDGLWDVLSEEEVIAFVLKSEDKMKVSEQLTNHAIELGSKDNISVIVIFLSWIVEPTVQ